MRRNTEHRVGTLGYAWSNPGRVHVSKEKHGWRVFRGTHRLISGLQTFAEAIEYAQKQARQ